MSGVRWILGCAMAFAALVPVAAQAQAVARDKVTAALPKFEDLAQQVVADGGVPGLAVAVVHRDEVVYLKGFGVREMGKPDRVDADTVFQIASFAKPVSATIVAALVSDGVMRWDSRIADLDPAFQLHDPYPTRQLTVRDLFNHRSGLPGEAGNELEALGYSRDEILRRLRLVPPASSFRAGYSYSNFGLTEGAVAAAKPTGKAWEDVAAETLYVPLGMTSTSSRHADFLKRSNRAGLHIKLGGPWVAALTRDPDAQAPAGGVSSNVRDLAQWMRLELAKGIYAGKPLIRPEALAATHVPLTARGNNPVTGAPSFYGLGWNVEFGRHGLIWGHAGAFSVGARTLVTLYPERDIGIVILTNAFPTGVPEGLAASFFDLVFDGAVAQDWITPWNKVFGGMFAPAMAAAKAAYGAPPASATPALPLTTYAGTYANGYIGQAVVVADGNSLQLKLGPNGAASFPLRHFNRDLFLYTPSAETPDLPSAVTFDVGAGGKATQVTIEDLNAFGLGVLTRVGD